MGKLIDQKLYKMYKEITDDACEGISQYEVFAYAAECMEEGDKLFTDGCLYKSMESVLREVLLVLKDNPEAIAKLKSEFNLP